ncbi:MAG: transcription antitermination factor NusB [Spirochaetota bacterium]
MNESNSISFKRQSRILAFQAIYINALNPQPIDELILFSWTSSIPAHVYKFAKELTIKTLEYEEIIIDILKEKMQNPEFDKISEVEKSILKISLCQLLYFPKISPAIVIDEAIELAKSFAGKNSYKMIHAVLDSIEKNIKEKSN